MRLLALPNLYTELISLKHSGKTSLLLTLLRLTEYTGTIEIDGIDISTIPPQQLRSCITTVSQDTIQIDGTVRENLLPYEGQLKDDTITEDILFEALDQTELTQIIEQRGGLEAQLSTMEFSQGQMQLLCLARAIVHHTCTQSRLVLLDESTSNLDLETDNRIQAAIRDAFLDCTILMVSHRVESLWDSNVRFEVKNKKVARFSTTPKPSPKPLPFHTMFLR
jgi:ABC-type multidrug transport system fused ATPase/permease subunit